MKKHNHINTIPTKESATTIEWDVVDKKPHVEIEVENAEVIGGSFFKETIAPTFWMVAEKVAIGLKKPMMVIRYQMHKQFKNVSSKVSDKINSNMKSNMNFDFASQLRAKNIPWMKIGLVAFAGYVLLKKDMTFNFNLSAPLTAFADDRDDEYEFNHTSAQTVANPYAPVSAGALSGREVEVFIKRYAPIAQKEMEIFGIPASIKMGQALIESRAGTSRLARNNNNYFGMKCFSKNCKKGHCSNATDDHHKDFFRKYASVAESFRAHSNLLSGTRYKSLKQHKNDYRKWAKGLKKKGYATDKTYDKKLINVIKKYKLYELDS